MWVGLTSGSTCGLSSLVVVVIGGGGGVLDPQPIQDRLPTAPPTSFQPSSKTFDTMLPPSKNSD